MLLHEGNIFELLIDIAVYIGQIHVVFLSFNMHFQLMRLFF